MTLAAPVTIPALHADSALEQLTEVPSAADESLSPRDQVTDRTTPDPQPGAGVAPSPRTVSLRVEGTGPGRRRRHQRQDGRLTGPRIHRPRDGRMAGRDHLPHRSVAVRRAQDTCGGQTQL